MFHKTLHGLDPGYCFDLITYHSLVGLHHSFVLASLLFLRPAKHAPTSGHLHLLHLLFPLLQQSFSREPHVSFLHFLRSLIKHQFSPSSFLHPFPLPCFIFLHETPPGTLNIFLFICLLAVSTQRNVSIRTEPFICFVHSYISNN